jgi:hypothetical protein
MHDELPPTAIRQHQNQETIMTLTITEAGGGKWMLTIESADGTTLSRSTPYINKDDARRAADRIVEGFGAATVLG